jgi:hypothetical protein
LVIASPLATTILSFETWMLLNNFFCYPVTPSTRGEPTGQLTKARILRVLLSNSCRKLFTIFNCVITCPIPTESYSPMELSSEPPLEFFLF